ncbi:MAG: hypothetical protein U0T79_05395 [Ferruginibacter sp.]
MKKFALTILLIPLSQVIFCQDSTFKVTEEKDIIWQKVIKSNVSFDSLYFELKRKGLFTQLDSSNSLILGELKRTSLDYSSFKENLLVSEIPIYIKQCDFAGSFEFEYKADRYRVTLKNIKTIGKAENGTSFWDIKPDETSPLSLYAFKLNKKELSKTFLKYSKPIFDKNFLSFFTISVYRKDTW